MKLADGKERQLQHMAATSFWSADGRPMSAAQFLESLFGVLPEFFKDEEELRRLWSQPDTRKKTTGRPGEQGLRPRLPRRDAEDHRSREQRRAGLRVLRRPTRPPRRTRAATATELTDKQRAFVDFVLAQHVAQGVDELDQEKLSPLLRLKYHNAIADAFVDLGKPEQVRQVFVGFQRHLYAGKQGPA